MRLMTSCGDLHTSSDSFVPLSGPWGLQHIETDGVQPVPRESPSHMSRKGMKGP